jgi:hypothetical protein
VGARHLEELVAQARAADAALAAARAGAEPAGDPDPYRIPGDQADGDGGNRPGGGDPLGGGAFAARDVPGAGDVLGAGDVPGGDPEEAYPDQVYPGDPEDAGRGGRGRWDEDRGNAVLGRGYPAGPAGPGGSGDAGGRGGTARWRR